MFTDKFPAYVCVGDTIECETADGFRIVATIRDDTDGDPPWERADGHGPVSEWTSRDKRPGERVLLGDGRMKRYYDFAEAVKTARADGWGCKGDSAAKTAGEKAAMAAEADFAYVKAWCNDEWFYCGISVQVFRGDEPMGSEYEDSLWGIEATLPNGGNDYLMEVAEEMADPTLDRAREAFAEEAADWS